MVQPWGLREFMVAGGEVERDVWIFGLDEAEFDFDIFLFINIFLFLLRYPIRTYL